MPTGSITTENGNRCSVIGSLAAEFERFSAMDCYLEVVDSITNLLLLFTMGSKMLIVVVEGSNFVRDYTAQVELDVDRIGPRIKHVVQCPDFNGLVVSQS